MSRKSPLRTNSWASSALRWPYEYVSGCHRFLLHPDGRCTVVPVHRGETIGRGLLAQILRDCDLTREDIHKKR
ncbi:MAG: type II toxin-antitoxin system HicA family toxin [Kiritimatiellae bacterium]|nr:type II toxin-antitoxin system HicA family toxin [Kiritimatiellia bacterium]